MGFRQLGVAVLETPLAVDIVAAYGAGLAVPLVRQTDALCTLLSRITGLARDITLIMYTDRGGCRTPSNTAFWCPICFDGFREGALSPSSFPSSPKTLDKEGRPAAWVLLGRVAGLMVLLLCAADDPSGTRHPGDWQFAPGGPMRTRQLGLTAVMLPFMISICMLALLSSILNCLHHFTVPALLPIVLIS